MMLAPFRALGLEWLLNPLLTLALGLALAGALARLGVPAARRGAAVALVLLTPFTLFLGGSFFPQTFAAATVAGIVWLQLGDEARAGRTRKIAIGMLFGLLLLTRYDVLAAVALPYAIDRLLARRWASVGDAAWMAVGFLPLLALHLAYNLALTGDPFMLPALWTGSNELLAPERSMMRRLGMAAAQDVAFAGELAQFGGLPLAALAVFALAARLRARTCRFRDFLLPTAVALYTVVPFSGGHQYGPRYWFWAWPICLPSVMSSLVDAEGSLTAGLYRVRFDASPWVA